MISNGIEVENLSDADREERRSEFRSLHNIPFDAPLIGTIGELIVLKGQRDFVLAANEVAKKFPFAHFVIVGKDNTLDKKFRRELKRLVKVFELEEHFLWLDWVDDTAQLFASLDIFVSASHTESFGLAILEALASGTVVIATETEGAKELVQDREMLVPIKEPVMLADKICELLENAELRKAAGLKFQRLAQENFSLERMIHQTENLYEEVLRN
jgi:glycosyltransferase involved in cell wall biosynthesis